MDLYWLSMAAGYGLTIVVETIVLVLGLARVHTLSQRVFAGVWLTSCTYPAVVVALPELLRAVNSRPVALAIIEGLVIVAECLLFWLAFGRSTSQTRRAARGDSFVIIAANLASFASGEALRLAHVWK